MVVVLVDILHLVLLEVDQVVVVLVVELKVNHLKTHHLLQIQTLINMEILVVLEAVVMVTGAAVVVPQLKDITGKHQGMVVMVAKEDCLLSL